MADPQSLLPVPTPAAQTVGDCAPIVFRDRRALSRFWWRRFVWDRLAWWPRLAARLAEGRSYTLSDSPHCRQPGQPLLHWIRFGRVGASHFLLAADPAWRAVLRAHGRYRP